MMNIETEAPLGLEDQVDDIATAAPLRGLAALLDYETVPWPGARVPPLGHWLYCHKGVRQSEIGIDGHPRLQGGADGTLPPRRMWAGSRIQFHAPIAVGAVLQRKTVVAAVSRKVGRSGPLVFVTLRHTTSADSVLAVTEEQDIVYRDAAGSAPAAASPIPTPGPAYATRHLTLDAVALFRYSALTFNGHRIHYDHDYATGIEGYRGLVVHGPLMATLLIDHFGRERPEKVVRTFSFRGRAPLFLGDPLTLCLRDSVDGAHLWIESNGALIMEAEIGARAEAPTDVNR